MNLADAIAAEPPGRKGPMCGVARLRLILEDDDLKLFDQLLDDIGQGRRSIASVTRILNRAGREFPRNRLEHHFRAECSCQRDPEGHVFWPTSL